MMRKQLERAQYGTHMHRIKAMLALCHFFAQLARRR